MASPRSVYSWDIVVQKIGSKLFLDKRDNSQFDYLTVNETASEPPSDEKDSINSPQKLSEEATFINQNFSQQVLLRGQKAHKFPRENPFQREGEEVASVAYRYRRWNLGDEIVLVARCELDGVINYQGKDVFLSIKALNEFDPKDGMDWRQKLDSQRGAVLATELKNNSNKLARWTAQAILAGAGLIKLGYVSRVSQKDSFNHVLLGTQTFQPREFATQFNLNLNNMWGILKSYIEMCMELSDGKYVFLKDPNKPIVRLYAIPDATFDETQGGEEREAEEEKDA